MEELKSCPCCNSKAVMYGKSITTGFGIYCDNDECGINIYDMYTKKDNDYATMRSKENAIKAWNERSLNNQGGNQ